MIESNEPQRALQALGIPSEDTRHLERLPGEIDHNYCWTRVDGQKFLLKVSSPDAFDQQPILEHLASKDLPFTVPSIVAAGTLRYDGKEQRVRLHSWVNGRVLDELRPRTSALWQSWGSTCGSLNRALLDLDYPPAKRVYKWDPSTANSTRGLLKYLPSEQHALASYFFDRLDLMDLAGLPMSLCYNDAHELNLLVGDDGLICGVIDFGDAVHTVSVSELAVACAYAGMQQPDPLGTMRIVTEAYHGKSPLTAEEVNLLYDLVAARLLLTVTAAAENRFLHPENTYLSVSEAPAWQLLTRWRKLSPALATATFRVACGLSAHPARDRYTEWTAASVCHPVMDLGGPLVGLDLSVGSLQLGGNDNFWNLPRFVTHIRRFLEDREAEVAVGGYGEVRPVYTTDAFEGSGNDGPRWRSVHLGLDFWTKVAGTCVYAPLDATIHSLGIDPTPGGYGGMLILAHSPTPDLTFYTLFGHLSFDSIRHWGAGAQVQAGQEIGQLGRTDENGGWPPHLHFQILLDTLGMEADYPGVAYPSDRDVWLGICPDPRSLLPGQVPAEVAHHSPAETLLKDRKQRLGYSLSVSYRRPLQILRGYRQYLYDDTGRRFLDTVNNVAHVGHEHPAIVAAGQRQMEVLNTNSRYLHPTLLQFADALARTLPGDLSVVHVVNSGSEANELALRMAEAVTGNRQVVAMDMGYHGNSGRTVDVSSYKFNRKGGKGRPENTWILPVPGKDDFRLPDLPPGAWSFIGETILSCAGQVSLPPGYLAKVYDKVRAKGGICIADEVQTGVGRIGSHWWAFESQGVVPDIVTIGKPLGNGHPLGAVVCTPRVAEAFANGMEYFNTFGGNPVSSAIGLAVLQTVEREHLREHALDTGNYLIGLLEQLRQRHPLITDVRGRGFFLGFELCETADAPATAQASYLKNRMRDLGFLMSTDGPHENVFKIKPPMCFSRANADRLCTYLDRVFQENAMQPRE